MSEKDTLDKLKKAAIEGDIDLAKKGAEEVLEKNIDVSKALKEGFGLGMTEIGERFARFEAFLPELMRAGKAMSAGFDILRPKLLELKGNEAYKGKVVIGTVYGDVHDVGRNLVSTFLSVASYEVFDLGNAVPERDFVKKAEEVDADIIALSCLITPSMYYQRDVITLLEAMGIRDKYYVIIGGGPITAEWTEQIKADGYGKYSEDAVQLCTTLIESKKAPGVGEPIIIGV